MKILRMILKTLKMTLNRRTNKKKFQFEGKKVKKVRIDCFLFF